MLASAKVQQEKTKMGIFLIIILAAVTLWHGTLGYQYLNISHFTTTKWTLLLYGLSALLGFWGWRRIAPIAGVFLGYLSLTTLNVLYSKVQPYPQLAPEAIHAFYFATLFSALKLTLIMSSVWLARRHVNSLVLAIGVI